MTSIISKNQGNSQRNSNVLVRQQSYSNLVARELYLEMRN